MLPEIPYETRQLMKELVESSVRSEAAQGGARVFLLKAVEIDGDDENAVLGLESGWIDAGDAELYCEDEVPGGSSRLHQSTGARTPDECTVIVQLDGHVLIVNVGPDGVAERGEGAQLFELF